MKIGSVAKQIERLPHAPLHEQAVSWLNTVLLLVDARDEMERRGATTYLEAMHEDWDRRRAAPRAGDMASAWPANLDRRRHGREDPAANSPLGVHGYHVGRLHGRPNAVRREVLSRCFYGPLMPAFPRWVMEDWGAPASGRRLAKMKSFLAYLIQRHEGDFTMKDSVTDWRKDQAFIQHSFDTPDPVRSL